MKCNGPTAERANVTETRSWDRRGRPLSDTDTGPGGVVYSYSVPSTGGYAANGDLLSYTDSVMGQWSFSYDKLDRLMTGTPSSGPYQGQYGCWNYDSFGNRTINVVSAAACTTTATATYNANNQITWLQNLGAPGYPPAGNVSSDSLNQYLYDNENRVCAVRNLLTYVMTGYLYDGGGARVAKGAVANLNACPAVQGFTSITAQYLLGLGGEQVTELDGSGNWQHTNLFAAGRLLATYDTRGQHFHFTDWLGTRRAQATAAGVSEEQCQSLPFGDGLSCSGPGVDATEHHFTGKERDTESGNDYFGARYYSSTVGRFMTPDWSLKAEPVPYARLDIPQTLNLYAYVGNNPLTHTDVDGHQEDPERDPLLDQDTQAVEQSKAAAKIADNNAQQAKENAPPVFVDPSTKPAALATFGILNGNNSCSAFIDGANPGSAAAMFSSESIFVTDINANTGNQTYSGGTGANSIQGAGSDSRIWINKNGPFFRSIGIVNFKMISLYVGKYAGGTLKAQVLIILHELAHIKGKIPADGSDPRKSDKNTNEILKYCSHQIDQLQ